ncbi:type II toxin-antitoxin system RelB/DinJ family antitoxin [Burkholderia gladioli]|uniref:type II toxin-antitoxin system RelB/DinJ family antitoxin n=1 Tax=Burkholderia gladioli TaxID=28095 RepID=UPI00163EE4D6|nr:type II toxin-antitoxin system RelB/DinJ family antitoxin [Burkholderia gladioli]
MAQVNIRVSDEAKAIAESVVAKAGSSLPEYLRVMIEFIAEHRALPVVIKTQTVATDPNEMFQEAVIRFRDTYMGVVNLQTKVLRVGEMTPHDKLRVVIDDIQSAELFYSSQEHVIENATYQLERIQISPSEYSMFACCREHFPQIVSLLRNAIRMVNMNNRPVIDQDLSDMLRYLEEAAKHINTLQAMIPSSASAGNGVQFILRDAEEALECARSATKPGEAYMVCTAWQNRMAMSIRQAEKGYRRLGVVPCLKELDLVLRELRVVANAVALYLDRTSEPMRGFDEEITSKLHGAILVAKNKNKP